MNTNFNDNENNNKNVIPEVDYRIEDAETPKKNKNKPKN